MYEPSRVKEEIFPCSLAFSRTWQTFKSPEISTVKLEPWISRVTVCVCPEGEGLGLEAGLGFMLALGEGEGDIAPKTTGEEEAEGPGTADPEGVVEGDGFSKGLTEAFTTGFMEGFNPLVGGVEALGEGLGRLATFSPNTLDCISAFFGVSGKRIDLKNTPEPSKTNIRSPERNRVSFGMLAFFI